VSDGVYRVNARLAIDELGDLFDMELDDDDVDSVGGLLTKAFGRLPVRGTRVHVSGLILTAERTDGRRRGVSTVLVERDPDAVPLYDTGEIKVIESRSNTNRETASS
jgi:Mg2+/Co2+ transporter CorC